MATVNAEKIARALNLTESRVHQLVKEGLPKEGRGQYDPVKCMGWYVRYLQHKIEQRTLPLDGDENERSARIRLLRTQADLKEIELAKQQSQFVTVQDADAVVNDLVRTTMARILAIPPLLAPELVGEQSRVMLQAKMEKACKQALSDLAKARFGENTVASTTGEVLAAKS